MVVKRRWILRWFIGFWLVMLLSFLIIDRGVAQQWQLTPTLTVSERYDDNIRLTEANPETDAVTTMNPGLSLAYKGKTIKLGAEYDAAIERFDRHPELNNVGHNASLDLELDQLFGSKTTSASLRNFFRFLPQLPTDQGAVTVPGSSVTGIGLPRSNVWANTAALTLTHLSSARLTERMEYLNTLTRFELPTLVDSTIHEGTIEAIYQLDPNNSIGSSYRLRYFDFVQQGTEDAIGHALMVGTTHQFSPSLSLTTRLGLSYSIQSGDRVITPIGMLHLSKSFEKIEIGGDYSRDISFTGGLSAQLVTTQTVTANLSYAVTQKTRAFLSMWLTDNRSITGEELKIVSWTVRPGLSYQILTWLSVEIRYHHFEQRGEGSLGSDLNQNQYFFSLTGKIPTTL